ncbi:uncharacterized protein V6R79_005223 [Siganus canaliculatus]
MSPKRIAAPGPLQVIMRRYSDLPERQGAGYAATMQQYKASWRYRSYNKDLSEDERNHPFTFIRGNKQSSSEADPGDNYRAKEEEIFKTDFKHGQYQYPPENKPKVTQHSNKLYFSIKKNLPLNICENMKLQQQNTSPSKSTVDGVLSFST